MTVHEILWIDPDTLEASAIIGDGEVQMRVYIPRYESGHSLEKIEIEALLTDNVILVDKDTPESVSFLRNGSYRSTVIGRVKSVEERTVEVGSFEIMLDEPLPGDANVGDKVKLDTARITMSII